MYTHEPTLKDDADITEDTSCNIIFNHKGAAFPYRISWLVLFLVYRNVESIHPSIHVYSQKVDAKCKQNHGNMQDRKVMQDSYNCPKNLN